MPPLSLTNLKFVANITESQICNFLCYSCLIFNLDLWHLSEFKNQRTILMIIKINNKTTNIISGYLAFILTSINEQEISGFGIVYCSALIASNCLANCAKPYPPGSVITNSG
jgi:hypothetical protein